MSGERGDDPTPAPTLLERVRTAFPVALKQDEAFRYALILGIIALVVAVAGHHHQQVVVLR